MAVCDAGNIYLFVRSIVYDLDVQQEAVTFMYEDNKGVIHMGNAQKPTSRTQHMSGLNMISSRLLVSIQRAMLTQTL